MRSRQWKGVVSIWVPKIVHVGDGADGCLEPSLEDLGFKIIGQLLAIFVSDQF